MHLGPPPATTYMPAARRPLSLPRSRAHDLGLAPPRFRPTPASPRPGLVPPRPRPASARSASVSVRLGLGPPRRRRGRTHVPRRLRRRRATATAVPPPHRTWREPPPPPPSGGGGSASGAAARAAAPHTATLHLRLCSKRLRARHCVNRAASHQERRGQAGPALRVIHKSEAFFRAPPLEETCHAAGGAIHAAPAQRRNFGLTCPGLALCGRRWAST